jgi:hypothetical protein
MGSPGILETFLKIRWNLKAFIVLFSGVFLFITLEKIGSLHTVVSIVIAAGVTYYSITALKLEKEKIDKMIKEPIKVVAKENEVRTSKIYHYPDLETILDSLIHAVPSQLRQHRVGFAECVFFTDQFCQYHRKFNKGGKLSLRDIEDARWYMNMALNTIYSLEGLFSSFISKKAIKKIKQLKIQFHKIMDSLFHEMIYANEHVNNPKDYFVQPVSSWTTPTDLNWNRFA